VLIHNDGNTRKSKSPSQKPTPIYINTHTHPHLSEMATTNVYIDNGNPVAKHKNVAKRQTEKKKK